MLPKTSLLIISCSPFISGAEQSMSSLIQKGLKNYKITLVLPKNCKHESFAVQNGQIYYIPLQWFCYTLNPIKLLQFVYSLILSSYYLQRIIRKQNIQLIYSNTIKAHLYIIFVNLFLKRKVILHIRDSIKPSFLYKLLINKTDYIIAVSKFIYNQIPLPELRKKLIYSGIDTDYWNPEIIEPNLKKESLVVAHIGQLTRWKNHIDFIKAAFHVKRMYANVKYYIIGDDQSGREYKYRKELEELISELGIHNDIIYFGYREDIKDIMSEIDILVHSAFNEPFGRVIIEAMALEKPVVAYDIGGPQEIIINNETGFLVKSFDYKALAEKVLILLKNEYLRKSFGKAGRKIVIDKFRIADYVSNTEALFDGMC